MRIVSLYIQGFGKLSSLSMDFSAGMNNIFYENGWGKSTLSAFLRAMFFGLDDSKRSIITNERSRYKPWRGDMYGGTLTLEVEGRTYRIERSFGKKSAEDTFTLYDVVTNLPSADYDEHIGEKLFGVNKESFERTVFLEQNKHFTEANDDMTAQIGGAANDPQDMNRFKKAMEQLQEAAKELKGRGGKGIIPQLQERIQSGMTQVAEGALDESAYEKLREQQEVLLLRQQALRQERVELEQKQRSLMDNQQLIASAERLESCKRELEEAQGALESVKQMLPGEVPQEEEVNGALTLLHQLSAAQARLDTVALNDAQRDTYQKLAIRFENGLPTETELEHLRGVCVEIRDLQDRQRQVALSAMEETMLEQLSGVFGEDMHPTAGAEHISQLITSCEKMEDDIQDLSEQLEQTEEVFLGRKKLHKRKLVCALIPAMLLFVAGVVLIVMNREMALYAAICFAVGGLYFASASLICNRDFKRKCFTLAEEKHALQEDISALEAKLQDGQEQIASYFDACGEQYNPDSSGFAVQRIFRKAMQYEELMQKKSLVHGERISEKLQELIGTVAAALSKYGVFCEEPAFVTALAELPRDASLYEEYHKRMMEEASQRSIVEAAKQQLRVLEERYQLPIQNTDDFQSLQNRYHEYTVADRRYSQAKDAMDAFCAENDVEQILSLKEQELPDPAILSSLLDENMEALDVTAGRLGEISRQMDLLEERLSELEEKEQDLNSSRERLAVKEQELRELTLTKELLESAKNAMVSKYTEPLLHSFEKHMGYIKENMTGDYSIDATTTVHVVQDGVSHSVETQSSGYRDLIYLCQRLAYIDAIYEDNEKPFLILDDPFVNLDDQKLCGGKKLLQNLAEEYQVIYLTCSNQRSME